MLRYLLKARRLLRICIALAAENVLSGLECLQSGESHYTWIKCGSLTARKSTITMACGAGLGVALQ